VSVGWAVEPEFEPLLPQAARDRAAAAAAQARVDSFVGLMWCPSRDRREHTTGLAPGLVRNRAEIVTESQGGEADDSGDLLQLPIRRKLWSAAGSVNVGAISVPVSLPIRHYVQAASRRLPGGFPAAKATSGWQAAGHRSRRSTGPGRRRTTEAAVTTHIDHGQR
jgi:hypothetical protein